MVNIDLVFILVLAIFIGYYMCKKESFDSVDTVEGFAAIDDARQAVKEIYNADVDAIRNLSAVATKLQAGGLTHPGRLTVNAGADHIPILAQSNTDSHILLRTKNDGNKDTYLINRDGHLRVHQANVGDMFGVNHDGHLYNEHTGDHVAHHIGRGANPYITISRAGQWGNSSWYMQNLHNGDPANSTFRIGKHDVGSKLDIGSDGYLNANGARLGTAIVANRNVISELNNLNSKFANMTASQVFNVNRGDGGWNGRTSPNFTVGTGKKIFQINLSLYVNSNNGVDINFRFSNGFNIWCGSYINHGGNHTGQSFTRVIEDSQLPAGTHNVRVTCNLNVDGNDYLHASIITLPV
jgi:hypothetical protein